MTPKKAPHPKKAKTESMAMGHATVNVIAFGF